MSNLKIYCMSLYNSNIWGGAWNQDSLEADSIEMPFDPAEFEDIIVINGFFSPLGIASGDISSALAFKSN